MGPVGLRFCEFHWYRQRSQTFVLFAFSLTGIVQKTHAEFAFVMKWLWKWFFPPRWLGCYVYFLQMFLLCSMKYWSSMNIVLLVISPFRMLLKPLDSWRSWVSQGITLFLPPPTKPLRVWAAKCWRDFRATRRSSKVNQTFIYRGLLLTLMPKRSLKAI